MARNPARHSYQSVALLQRRDLPVALRQLLQLDRGLRLENLNLVHAQQPCGGIEQPPGASGDRAVQVALQHRRHRLRSGWLGKRCAISSPRLN